MTDPCAVVCRPVRCDSIFTQITVLPRIAGGTTVEWRLQPDFVDPLPHTFQLQTGAGGTDTADDWEDVGLPAENAAHLVDDQQRVFGKTQWTHFRVKLTTSRGVYYSPPEGCFGQLTRRWWNIYREVLRRESLMLRKATGQDGYLLKMRYTGEACPRCIDFMTDEVRDAQCPVCLGTGRKQGYYLPVSCCYAALEPFCGDDLVDGNKGRGTINEIVTKARMLATPDLARGDVWISASNDFRWKIRDTHSLVEVRGVPVVQQPEIALIPFSDQIYQIPVE